MNRSSAWFDKHYQGIDVKPIIIPSAHLRRFHPFGRGDAGERTKTVRHAYERVLHVVLNRCILKLCRAGHIQKLEAHVLSVPALLSDYSKKLKNLK